MMPKLFIAIVLIGMLGCASKPPPTPMPEFVGVARRAEELAGSLGQAWGDGKSVQKLQQESLSLVDALDEKIKFLLESPKK